MSIHYIDVGKIVQGLSRHDIDILYNAHGLLRAAHSHNPTRYSPKSTARRHLFWISFFVFNGVYSWKSYDTEHLSFINLKVHIIQRMNQILLRKEMFD